MTAKDTLTIEEFSAQLANQPQSSPEIKAFGQLTVIASPAKVEAALPTGGSWGWW